MALMQVPPALVSVGVTVMDGPFFSMMPFPARGLHTLSHVRYTPHCNWADQPDLSLYQKLDSYSRETRVDRMVRDVTRYMPAIQDAKYVDSLFEVKTILVKNEGDDGRSILFENHFQLPGCYSILGGKIDNIYDVLEKLDAELLFHRGPDDSGVWVDESASIALAHRCLSILDLSPARKSSADGFSIGDAGCCYRVALLASAHSKIGASFASTSSIINAGKVSTLRALRALRSSTRG